MSDQLALAFDAPATRGASRQSDPATAREAGRSVSGHVLRDQQRLVLETIAAIAQPYNRHCASAYDVVERLAARGNAYCPQQSVVAKRCGELTEAGMIEDAGITRPGSSGRQCRCFRVTDAGRAYLADRSAA